jgi:glycosyltransferase involved in cell wall biosynthesis
MRISFFTHYTELYGANRSLLNLIDGLAPYGVRAHVVCPHPGDLLDELTQRRIPAAVLPFEWWVSSHRTAKGCRERSEKNAGSLAPIVAQLARWRTDVVYSNSSVIDIGSAAAAKLGRPHVWHVREFGAKDYDLVPDPGVRAFRRTILSADAVIFVSHALKRHFVGAAIPPRTHVIYNGVASTAVFDERRRRAEALRGRRQPFTFALVGRFRASKGQAVAIPAFAEVARRFPKVRLLLVGDAGRTGEQEYFNECRALVAELAVADRIEFWGFVPDPERAYLAADAVLMCSRNEAMGRVTVEAMSACRPVIGFDSGGTTELIEPGRTGLLYAGGAVELARCMLHYIEKPELTRQHGDAAWSAARVRHSTETYAAQVHEVLRGARGATGAKR